VRITRAAVAARVVFFWLLTRQKKSRRDTAGKVSHKSEISIEVSAEREMPDIDFEFSVCMTGPQTELIWRNFARADL